MLWPLILPPPAPSPCSSHTGPLADPEPFQTQCRLRAFALAAPSPRMLFPEASLHSSPPLQLRSIFLQMKPSARPTPTPLVKNTTLNPPLSIHYSASFLPVLTAFPSFNISYALLIYDMYFFFFNSLSLTLGYTFTRAGMFGLFTCMSQHL